MTSSPASADWTVTVTLPQIGVRLASAKVERYWTSGLNGFKLQAAESLAFGILWRDVAPPPVEANGEVTARLGQGSSRGYFRLFRP